MFPLLPAVSSISSTVHLEGISTSTSLLFLFASIALQDTPVELEVGKLIEIGILVPISVDTGHDSVEQ